MEIYASGLMAVEGRDAREAEMSVTSSPRIVTTSWDDGDPSDMRIAELLAARKIKGTFYVPVERYRPCGRMTPADLRSLAGQGFEIGAHGVSHANLALCNPGRLAFEVEHSKATLEDTLGQEVRVFAYPRGRYNQSVIAALQRAGFAGARTTRMFRHGFDFSTFEMPTSIQVYPHSRSDYMRNLVRGLYFGGSWKYVVRPQAAGNWADLAVLLLDNSLAQGGVWHLYGHSWEIRQLDLWKDLERVLAYAAARKGVHYLSNGEVLDRFAN